MIGELENKFERIGARVRIRPLEVPRFSVWSRIREPADGVRLDVLSDRHGEMFDVEVGPRRELAVIDVRPRERHLLLMVRNEQTGAKEKFPCGHDERHWFVAAVPGDGVSNVATAMEALKPAVARASQDRAGVRRRNRNRRHNAGFVRQGEWFFVPAPRFDASGLAVLHNEPLRRGGDRRGGKPHWVDEVARTGGELVYVSRAAPTGVTEDVYRNMLKVRSMSGISWTTMRRNARVFARGRVRHSDHATILLPGWHEVLINREGEAPAMRHVVFLD